MWPFSSHKTEPLPPAETARLFIARKWFFFQETQDFGPDTPLSVQLAAFSARYLDQIADNDVRLVARSRAELEVLLLDGIASTGAFSRADLEQARVPDTIMQRKAT